MARPAKTNRAAILRAALAVVDEEGLSGLTLRKVADRVGVEPMSLYRYVDGKAGLLHEVHGAVLADMVLPDLGGPWEVAVAGLARSLRDALAAHPNALPLFATRPAEDERSLALAEAALAVLAPPFPAEADRFRAFQALASYVVGQSLWAYANQVAVTDADDGVPADRFPVLRRSGSARAVVTDVARSAPPPQGSLRATGSARRHPQGHPPGPEAAAAPRQLETDPQTAEDRAAFEFGLAALIAGLRARASAPSSGARLETHNR